LVSHRAAVALQKISGIARHAKPSAKASSARDWPLAIALFIGRSFSEKKWNTLRDHA
jgi:hypothetical protein